MVITGGAIASMLLKEPVNDFDVYLRTKQATRVLAEYYVAKFSAAHAVGHGVEVAEKDDGRIQIKVTSRGVAGETTQVADGAERQYIAEVLDDPGDIQDRYEDAENTALETGDSGNPAYRPVFLSTNAITLSNRIQIVLRFYGEPDAIHENYDYVHCTNYWTSWNGELVLRPKALEALLARELVYIGSKYPVCSIIRLRKFIKRGWTVNAGQMLKAMMQISALDLTNIDVLQDQLTGVDCAYFSEVISLLRDKDPDKVSAAYLIEIIDRMF